MNITHDHVVLCAVKHKSIRYAQRGKLFKKPAVNRIDPNTVTAVHGHYDLNHVQGYFMDIEDTLYVSFCGSNEWSDWLYNIWAGKSETPYRDIVTHDMVKVHSGFYHSYLPTRDLIHDKIKKTANPKIIVNGYSLGGAMATLCALDVQYNFPDKDVGCITFGSPRVGNKAFADSFNRRVPNTIRCVHANDIVPSVPFERWGFHHIGELMSIGDKRKRGISIKDHAIYRYVSALRSTEVWHG